MGKRRAKLNRVCDKRFAEALYCPMTLTPDPHGQAALMLCESLMLLLVERGVIGKDQAANAIDGIIEVKREIAGKRESVVVSVASIALLQDVAQSVAAAPELVHLAFS